MKKGAVWYGVFFMHTARAGRAKWNFFLSGFYFYKVVKDRCIIVLFLSILFAGIKICKGR